MIHYITTNGIMTPWVAAEVRAMRDRGVPCVLHSMRPMQMNFFTSAWARAMAEETRILYPLPPVGLAVSMLLAPLLFRGRFFAALLNAVFGEREHTRARIAGIAHLLVACHWARKLRRERVSLIHAHWIHSCGTIGMYGAWLLGAPFSFTGHAVDLFRDRCALKDKVRRADAIVCISTFHRDLYRKLGADDAKLHVSYCGIDVDQFDYRPRQDGDGRPRILSLGRLVEKKGFDVLIDACALLDARGVSFECEIAGDGPWEERLMSQVAERGVGHCVNVTGRRVMQEDLPDWLSSGHIFAQPCVWSGDNDVDGTPRTLMEAMACGLAAVSTRIAGIPDIVEDGVSGLLVEPRDASALADALQELIEHRSRRLEIVQAGRARMEEMFNLATCVEPVERLFRSYLDGDDPSAADESESPPAELTDGRMVEA